MPLLLDRFMSGGDAAPRSSVLMREVGPVVRAQCLALAEVSRSTDLEIQDRHVEIAGFRLHVRFVGQELASLFMPPLAHRLTTDGRAQLSVRVIDAATTGIAVPKLPDSLIANEAAASRPDILLYLDEAGDQAVYWLRDARSLPICETAAPMRPLLHWWLQSRGLHLMHAAAVGSATGGVLLIGPSGSGKSTSALACLGSPLQYAGDDYVLVGTRPNPVAHSLFISGKLHADHARRLPHLLSLVSNPSKTDCEKAVLMLNDQFLRGVAREFPLRAILLPKVTGERDSAARPIHPALALRAMAPSTLFQLPGIGTNTFEAMADLTRRLPCHQLLLGTDLSQVPVVIGRILDTHANGAESFSFAARESVNGSPILEGLGIAS